MTPISEEWGAVRILTPAGRFYIVVDERERARRDNGKRILFTKSEFMRIAPLLKMMTPFERYLYMKDLMQVKSAMPSARVEDVRCNLLKETDLYDDDRID